MRLVESRFILAGAREREEEVRLGELALDGRPRRDAVSADLLALPVTGGALVGLRLPSSGVPAVRPLLEEKERAKCGLDAKKRSQKQSAMASYGVFCEMANTHTHRQAHMLQHRVRVGCDDGRILSRTACSNRLVEKVQAG